MYSKNNRVEVIVNVSIIMANFVFIIMKLLTMIYCFINRFLFDLRCVKIVV